MRRLVNAGQIIMLSLPLMLPGLAWAAPEGDSLSGSNISEGQSAYQFTPSASGNIIGYRPISNDMLPGLSNPAIGATSSSALPGQEAKTAGQAFRGKGQSQLPAAYLTGILGDGPYTLGRDDLISIQVRGQQEFSGNFAIGFDGRIQYNYIGDIPIAGLTKYEVEQVLEKLLKKYIRVPSVSVKILAYNSKVIYVIGEVGRPGKFIMRGDAIKLREAILAAGLPNRRAALSRVHVIKPDIDNPRVRVINMKRILYKGKLKDDIDLHPGEIVVVPSTVMSKVNDFLGTLLNPVSRVSSVAYLGAI